VQHLRWILAWSAPSGMVVMRPVSMPWRWPASWRLGCHLPNIFPNILPPIFWAICSGIMDGDRCDHIGARLRRWWDGRNAGRMGPLFRIRLTGSETRSRASPIRFGAPPFVRLRSLVFIPKNENPTSQKFCAKKFWGSPQTDLAVDRGGRKKIVAAPPAPWNCARP
jgi:hypothetical protein